MLRVEEGVGSFPLPCLPGLAQCIIPALRLLDSFFAKHPGDRGMSRCGRGA